MLFRPLYIAVAGASIAVHAMAEPPAAPKVSPSQAFWLWFDDYADQRGQVMDPLTYAELLKIKPDRNTDARPSGTAQGEKP